MQRFFKEIFLFAFVATFVFACGTNKKVTPVATSKLSEQDKAKSVAFFFEASKEKLLGNFIKAKTLYELTLRIDPNNDAVLYELARIDFQMGEYVLAEEKLKKSISLKPKNVWYKKELIQVYESLKKYQEASNLFVELEKQTPYDTELYYNHAYSLLKLGKLKEAAKVYDKVEEQMGVSEEISIQKQRIYLNIGDLDNAVKEIEKLIKSDPENTKYYLLLAEMYAANNKKEEAFKTYQRLLSRNPKNGDARLALSEYYRLNGDVEKAQQERIAAFKTPEIDLDKKVKTLLAYYSINDKITNKHSYQLCDALLETHPSEAKVYTIYGDFLYRDDSLKRSREMYNKALELDQSKFPIWNQVLIIDSQLKDYQTMIEDANKAKEYFPNQPLLLLFKGLGYISLKDYKNAIEAFNMGLNLVVDNNDLLSEFHSHIGECNYQLKEYKSSYLSFDKALEINPNNALVLNNYSYYLSLKSDSLSKAEKMSALSNKIEPNNPSYLDTYGWIMYQQGKYKEAMEWLEKATKSKGGENGVIIEHLGDTYWKLNKKKEALELWKKAKLLGEGSEFLDKKIMEEKLYE